ncbi:APC family permease [Sphingomonas arenae]|uniref:APC family permease n=1 Tax=Sphingomonas arenae TaxID=2812555 RepID=UPI00196743C1|nr:APC family permease [Sphingomonas arenae]
MSGPAADQPSLRRDIGPLGSALLCFNGIVGAGIFALPGTLHAQFGSFSPWLFPLFGSLFLLIVIPFARLAALFPVSGGPVAYTAVLGRPISFQVGWLYFLARVTALAANATVFATYAGALWPPLGTTLGRAVVLVTLVALLTWINLIGLRRAVRALDALSLLKALPLVALALWALASSGAVPSGPPPEFGAFEAAALATLYAFVGFENSVVPAAETRSPERTIPRALIATVIATAALYTLVQLAYAAVMPPGPQPDAPLAAMAEALIGPAGILILSLTAMASVAGNLLGSLTSTPRVLLGLTDENLLPRWFGRVHPAWHTPANAILFMGAVGLVLALSGSFVWLAVISTLARLFIYGASLVALPVASRRLARPLGLAMLTVTGAGLLLCLWAAAQAKSDSWVMLGASVAVGLLLFVLARRR